MRYRGYIPIAVLVLIGINLILFIFTSTNRDLAISLGFLPASFLDKPWTILTNLFVHANIWHILGNMITLYFFGNFLTRLVGEKRFLITYFAGGILGNLFYLLIPPHIYMVIGASGAVYAVAGALVVMMPNLRVLVYFLVPMPLWVVVLVFFVLWSIPNIIPDVAWQAHLGGLAFGLIMGFFFRRRGRYYY